MSWGEYVDSWRICFEEVETATNNFADENLLKRGASYDVYKGQLIDEQGHIHDIVARVSKNKIVSSHETVFSYHLDHKNMTSLFKVCVKDDVDQLIMLNKYEANESLDKHLSSPTLTWIQRLHICVGVAQALKYLHNDVWNGNYYLIHANIKSSKILLDHNWEPKLHGLGFSIFAKKHSIQRYTKYNGSPQHMDPAYEITRVLTHKSDVFSFGVLLFEVLFGTEAYVQNNDNWYFARLARSHYEDSKLDDLINPNLRKQMNTESFNIFAKIAYYCLKEHRSQRPDMNQLLSKLEKALELQDKHEHPVTLATAIKATSSSNLLKGKNLDHLKFRLRDIELATNKFSETYRIGSGGYGEVYKAQLDLGLDLNSLAIEGNNGGKLPKKHSTVAIKRIFSRVDELGEQSFFAEIEMLSNCKHPNIVSLQGFCDEGEELILIYEYVSNGSLADYLENSDNMTNLTWAQRIQICLDIAHGLNYLHTSTEDKESIIHRDIKSDNILLDDKWVAKIADFGLSKLHHVNQQGSTLVTNNIAGTNLYLDPEYMSTGKLKTKSDVYSFGVVLLEIISGKLAYDKTFVQEGLPSIARQCLNEGTLNNLIDPKILEDDESISLFSGGANQDSLDTFTKVAFQCLAKTQFERPTMEVVIKELTIALNFQKTYKNNLHISLEAIKSATKNFKDSNCIGEGRSWKLYEGEVVYANECTPVIVKRWDRESPQRHTEFLVELDILLAFKHDNLITLVGYCKEMDENIIVYEHASNGKLDMHLCDCSLTWMKRLKICIDVAKGLGFLHKGIGRFIHKDIRSSSILLDGDWNAKISNFESTCGPGFINKLVQINDNDSSSLGYTNLEYEADGFITVEFDVYSLGVILTEMLCGRLAWLEGCVDHSQSLGPLFVRHYHENGGVHKMIFEAIKEQIAPQSLNTFQSITLQCLKYKYHDRPEAHDVVIQLEKALRFQEDYEIWEPKLPIDYKEIIDMSKHSEINHSKTKQDLYDMFFKGIMLQDNKLLFSLGSNGERNEMISARMFTYKNRTSYRWQTDQESRFPKVAEIYDISKLKIRIKITTRLLSLDVNYGAYIIFKFCDMIKFSSKPMYVNLKYKKGGVKLQAYFATWRDDKWMMIELCRFFNQKKETDFDFVLESFSQYYCGKGPIRVEGIEFRVIDKVKNELQQTLESNSNKLSSPKEINEKNDFILSAKEVLYDSFNEKHFQLKQLVELESRCRFKEVIELQPRQVFRIKCKIQSQMLSQDIEYSCYIIFKLSEKCRGLHCPVKVRDLLHRNNKEETEIIYFRSPDPWNLHENMSVPKQRADGWMEVKVWKFNSNHQLKDGCVPVNLKFISYEGTMSGLIVCGLEFWAMPGYL